MGKAEILPRLHGVGSHLDHVLLPSLRVFNVSGQWRDDGVTHVSVAATSRSARPLVSHVDRVSARCSNRSTVCPLVSPFSVPGVSGSVATTHVDQSGSACTLVSSSSRRGDANALLPSHGVSNVSTLTGRENCPDAESVRTVRFTPLVYVLVLTHKRASKKGRPWWLRKDHSTQVGFSAGPSAHRQFTPNGSGMVAPPVVPLFPTSTSNVVSTRDDLFGNTHKGDQPVFPLDQLGDTNISREGPNSAAHARSLLCLHCICCVCLQCHRSTLGSVLRLCMSTAPRRVARPRTAQDNHSEFQDKLVETPS